MQSGALVDSSYGDSIRKALGLGFPPRGPERQGEGPRGAGLAAGGQKGLSCGWSQTPPLNSAGLASNGLRGPSPAKEVSEGKKKDDNL